jgi:hypothetical protein
LSLLDQESLVQVCDGLETVLDRAVKSIKKLQFLLFIMNEEADEAFRVFEVL